MQPKHADKHNDESSRKQEAIKVNKDRGRVYAETSALKTARNKADSSLLSDKAMSSEPTRASCESFRELEKKIRYYTEYEYTCPASDHRYHR
jgi:hypothetical protein